MLLKRIISILITSLLIMALTGCGSGGGGTSGVTSTGGGTTGGTFTAMSWNAPTKNTDGSLLTDLAGYKVYYGTSSGHYTGSIKVIGKNSTSISAATLTSSVPAPGTYYIVVTAYDTSGIESDYSNEVNITL